MKKFTVFANYFIDIEETFLRLKDSFFSFHKANISDWRINIRGKYKHDVKKFLEKNITKDLEIYFLNSEAGWLNDSLEICNKIKSEITFFWIEDHICIDDVSKINSIAQEMYENKVDYLLYTFFHKGQYLDLLEATNYNKKKHISFFKYDIKNYESIKNWGKKKY